MKITVYGAGCAKCHEAEELVCRVAAEIDPYIEVEMVDDPQRMVSAGVLSTPAVAVDGRLKSAGRVPTEEQVRDWIADA